MINVSKIVELQSNKVWQLSGNINPTISRKISRYIVQTSESNFAEKWKSHGDINKLFYWRSLCAAESVNVMSPFYCYHIIFMLGWLLAPAKPSIIQRILILARLKNSTYFLKVMYQLCLLLNLLKTRTSMAPSAILF